MKIAFYNHGIPFHGHTPHAEPLGGSESGIVYMARAQARLGHDVTVYCNCPEPAVYDSVTYRHYHQFFADYRAMPWDVLIAFRSFDPLLLGRIAPRTIFWTGDAYNQPALTNLAHPILQENLDAVFCVSEWQRQTFLARFGLPEDKVVATRNGFPAHLLPPPATRNWNRAAYTSTPFRGLHILLQLFPEIRDRVPDMTLDVYSSMRVYGWAEEEDRRLYGEIYDAARQPGVNWHGSVPQPALLSQLARTGFLLYPNIFEETSCIAAIEAQACGAVVITSASAGLNETVENGRTGICISGDPHSESYQREFIEAVAALAANPELLWKMSDAAQERATRKYSWDAVAQEWTAFFERMTAHKVHQRWSGPLSLLQKCHEFLENGNRSAATRVLGRLEETPFFQKEVAVLRQQMERSSASA